MIAYPAQYPPPLRAQFSTDHDFLTVQTPMQGGYLVQRRLEPHIFKQVSLAYRMSVQEFFGWWEWAHRYGFIWHLATIQGAEHTLRFIADVQFQYLDYATVEASVLAELTVPEEGEFWDEATDGAPDLYVPPDNDAYAADGTGAASIDLDFRAGFAPFDDELVSGSKDYVIATSRVAGAVSSVLVISDSAITLELHDVTATTLIRSTTDGFLRWHHDAPADNSMFRLDAGAAYVLRVVGAPATAYKVWGYTR